MRHNKCKSLSRKVSFSPMLIPLALLVAPSSAVAASVPLVTATHLPSISPEAVDWPFAPQVTGFRVVQDGRLAAQQTFAQIGYDEKNLYVRYRCPVSDTSKLSGETRGRDGSVWQDDAVELFLDPDQTRAHFYHLIVNCRGSQYDSHDGDPSWNGDWTVVADVSPAKSGWSCTLTIPFAALGRLTPKPGEKWGINFCSESTFTGEAGGWSYTEHKFEQPALFGVVVFQPDAPAIKLNGLQNLVVGPGNVVISVVLRAATQLTLTGKIGNSEHTLVNQSSPVALPQGGEQYVEFKFEAKQPGQFVAEFRAVAADGTTLFATETPLTVRPPVLLSLKKFLFEGLLETTVDATVLPQPEAGLKAEVTVIGPDGSQLDRQSLPTLRGKKGVVNLHLKDAIGNITVRATVLNAAGETVSTGETTVERPPMPAWFNTTAGMTDKVLPPFEPIRVKGDRARIWGRELDFKGQLLPASIVSQGKELLAAPISVMVRTQGKSASLHLPGRTWDKSQVSVSRAAEENLSGLHCRGKATLDYDGCMKVAVELLPSKATTVDGFSLDIPLRPDVAKYLHACSVNWSDTQSHAIPSAGWKSKFMPYLWVGDEDRGLAWFAESNEGFSLSDPNATLEIVPQADRTLLRINVITQPTQIEKPLKLVFGLQPTPVKPVPAKKPHVWHGAYFGIESGSVKKAAALLVPAAGNIDMRKGTLEIVATVDFDPAEAARDLKNQTLFHLRQPNGDQVCLFYDYVGQGMWFYLGIGEGYPQKYPVHITANNLGWKKGETHHIALTWGPKTVMFLDGKQAVVSAPNDGWMSAPLKDEKMAFGTDIENDQAGWVLHAVRISSDPLAAEEIAANAELVRDKGAQAKLPLADDTLVLLHPRSDGTKQTSQIQTPKPDKLTSGAAQLFGGAELRPDGVHFNSSIAYTPLDVLKEKGVDVIVFHDRWTNHFGYPKTIWGDKLKSLVKGCHDRGIKLLLYFGYGLGNLTPEMQLYHDEWTVWPLIPWYGGIPERNFDAGCNRTPLTQFLLDGIDKLTDEYDIDGVYLDGTTEPFGCINNHHGCGYLSEGTWRRTNPFWANRDFIRRMCTIFRQKRKEAIVDVHMSANLTIPTLAFCDSYWDGEQFNGYLQGQKDPRALLPLDGFRAEFMGRQFGLRSEFLVNEGHPFTSDEALSVTLLHNVLVRATGFGEKLDKLSAIWKAQDEFGVAKSEFLPYWSNQNLVQAKPDNVYVSAYRRAGVGLLLVVSNLGKDSVDASISLQLQKLGLSPGRVQATDAIAKQPLNLTAGTLDLKLAPMQWRMVVIRKMK